MPVGTERPNMHVEGEDDQHSIVHLLIRHGLGYDAEPWPAGLPEFKQVGNVHQLLKGMETAVSLSTGRAVGFVLDADRPLQNRWTAVRDRLRTVDVDASEEPQPDGYIGRSEKYKAAVGVWLMPDNQHDGTLETFLRTLVDEQDGLIGYADEAASEAKARGAEFSDVDQTKAVLHTWLAWRKEPGRPYGTAIRAKYFRHDARVAVTFVAWFKRLYGIG